METIYRENVTFNLNFLSFGVFHNRTCVAKWYSCETWRCALSPLMSGVQPDSPYGINYASWN